MVYNAYPTQLNMRLLINIRKLWSCNIVRVCFANKSKGCGCHACVKWGYIVRHYQMNVSGSKPATILGTPVVRTAVATILAEVTVKHGPGRGHAIVR